MRQYLYALDLNKHDGASQTGDAALSYQGKENVGSLIYEL